MEFISVGEGWVGDPNLPPLVPYIPSSCPFILGFLPLALVYRLQNTNDCRVIYPPSAFSSLPSLIPPAHILTISRLPVFPPHISPKGDIAVARRSLTHYEIFKYFV